MEVLVALLHPTFMSTAETEPSPMDRTCELPILTPPTLDAQYVLHEDALVALLDRTSNAAFAAVPSAAMDRLEAKPRPTPATVDPDQPLLEAVLVALLDSAYMETVSPPIEIMFTSPMLTPATLDPDHESRIHSLRAALVARLAMTTIVMLAMVTPCAAYRCDPTAIPATEAAATE